MLKILTKKKTYTEKRNTARISCYQQSFFSVPSVNASHVLECDIYDISNEGIGFNSNVRIDEGQRIHILFMYKMQILKLEALIVRHKFHVEHRYGAKLLNTSSTLQAASILQAALAEIAGSF